ncbi:MAG: META domain-containing protein [Hyphomonadaceae bacterium]|nr:META domain-containing protein [Hyphomonadaceae bacterium]
MRHAAFIRHIALLSVAAGLAACGSPSHNELPDDLGGAWVVQQIAGASLGDGVEIYMDINASTGAITGFTGCNRFSATMTAFSDALAVGAVQEQPGECASPEAATDEARFLGVLPSVHRFLRRGKSLELLPQQQGEALLRLRVDDFGTVTRPVTEAPTP